MITLKLKAFGTHFFGRTQGREIGERLFVLANAAALANPEIVNRDIMKIDLEGVAFFDYTFADEAFASTIANLIASDGAARFLAFRGTGDAISSGLQENIVVALERRELCAYIERDNGWDILGEMPMHLRETLACLNEKRLSAHQLADALGTHNMVAAYNRLQKLRGRCLVRIESEHCDENLSRCFYSRPID